MIAWYEQELQGAGYATDALNGPMEDGSYTLDMTGQPAGCRLEVATAPMGGERRPRDHRALRGGLPEQLTSVGRST